jgi:hypothetical protein
VLQVGANVDVPLVLEGRRTHHVRCVRSTGRRLCTRAAIRDDKAAQCRNISSELGAHNHFRAARLELTGRLSTGFQHVHELRDFANGLRTSTARLRNMLGNPNLDDPLRTRATELLSQTSRLLDNIDEVLR